MLQLLHIFTGVHEVIVCVELLCDILRAEIEVKHLLLLVLLRVSSELRRL